MSKVDGLKVLGATIIVLAAVAIMLPGLTDYLGSLSRLAIYVCVAIFLALAIRLTIKYVGSQFVNKSQKPDGPK